MIANSILQDAIGFLHLSHFCYWYICVDEEAALEYVSMDDDVGENVKNFVTMVSFISRFIACFSLQHSTYNKNFVLHHSFNSRKVTLPH